MQNQIKIAVIIPPQSSEIGWQFLKSPKNHFAHGGIISFSGMAREKNDTHTRTRKKLNKKQIHQFLVQKYSNIHKIISS